MEPSIRKREGRFGTGADYRLPVKALTEPFGSVGGTRGWTAAASRQDSRKLCE